MDKESLLKRRADLAGGVQELEKMIVYLSEQLEERQRNLIATNAAISECDFWLSQIEGEEDPLAEGLAKLGIGNGVDSLLNMGN